MKLFKTDFLKNAGMLLSGSMLAQVVGFAALYYLGRWYEPYEFGALETFLKLTGIFAAVAGLRYEMAIVVEEKEDNAIELTRLSLFLNLVVSVLLLLVALLFAKSIASFLNMKNEGVLYFVPLVVALTSFTETLVLYFNRKKKYGKISSNRVVTSFAATGYKLGHYWVFTKAINGLIVGQIIGQTIGFLQMVYEIPFRLWDYNVLLIRRLARKYREFPRYSMPAALLNIVATSMPFFIIGAFDSQTAVGYLGNAYKLTYLPLSMLSMAVGQVFFERIARLKNNKDEAVKLSHELFGFLFVIALLPVVVFAVWGDVIAPLVLGPNWNEAGVYIQITIPFYFTMFITSAFSSAFETYNKLYVQLIYNAAFLLLTSLAMYVAYKIGGSTRTALAWFVIVGSCMRIGILNYFFFLFGKNLIVKTIFAILITGFLIWLGFGIKEGFRI